MASLTYSSDLAKTIRTLKVSRGFTKHVEL